MPPLIRALRPPEWIKNLLVFAGLLFSGQLDEGAQVVAATLTFVAFCGASSAGYLLNDLLDREHDRRHPEKRIDRSPAARSAPVPRPRSRSRSRSARSRSASRSSPRSAASSRSTGR